MIRELQMEMETYEILKDLLPSSFPNPTATVPLDRGPLWVLRNVGSSIACLPLRRRRALKSVQLANRGLQQSMGLCGYKPPAIRP